MDPARPGEQRLRREEPALHRIDTASTETFSTIRFGV